MKIQKKLLAALLLLAVLLSAALGIRWHLQNQIMVELRVYPKDARQLDLRDRKISIRHYDKILRRLPGCQVFWNVPFQETALPHDSKEISVNTLTETDLAALAYFPLLETVDARDCTDYRNLLTLQQSRPEVDVQYRVKLGMNDYSCRAREITLKDFTADEVANLAYLPGLEQVFCSGGEETAVARLADYCREQKLACCFVFGDKSVALDADKAAIDGITEEQLALLRFLPDLKTLHLNLPKVPAEQLLQLQSSRPDVEITWNRKLFGKTVSSDTTEIDLSDAGSVSLGLLEQQMAYFPEAELVFLGECGLENELLAEHREKVRDQYKLVWTVSCGKKLKARTDDLTFMPVREYVYYFNDEEAYNLRYCEDMVCIDIGHMNIRNIDFVEFMPDLEYLILAHTQLQYIEPISTCKKLKFLELDWSPVRDLSPLVDCTALEDLNLGKVYADFTPIGKMTWLKNLWMVECSPAARYQMTQALPNTKVMVTGDATVANGWRRLDNYYEMRDLLGMYYMYW